MTGGSQFGETTAKRAMKNNLNSLVIGLALLIGSNMARSATLAWINPAGCDWNDSNNWS